MKYARIVAGIVDSISHETETGKGWLQVDDSVFAGFAYDGTTFTAPVIPPKTTSGKIADALAPTESSAITSRMLENLIIALEANSPVPQRAKAWAHDRASKRTLAKQ